MDQSIAQQPLPLTGYQLARLQAARAALQRRTELRQLLFILAHIPLGLLLESVEILSSIHAYGVLALGVHWAMSRTTQQRAVLAAAYIAGGEVLWRMTGARTFWEHGKYAVVLLLALVIIRSDVWRRSRQVVLAYLLLLLPSIALTLSSLGVTSEARSGISFNLSGPLALVVCALLFTGIGSARLDLHRLLLAMLAPVTSILTLAVYNTVTAQRIVFSTGSNFVTSGGFGPNQVSAVLGLGALLAMVCTVFTSARSMRWAMIALGFAMLTQAVLTFSRGGVLTALIAMGLFGIHLFRQRRARATFITAALVGLFLASRFVLPALDQFTGGALTARYSELDPSIRKSIAQQEIEIWRAHPILGVGPGMSKYYREDVFQRLIAAHTEFTRLLAEHGIFGAFALLILVLYVTWDYLKAPTAMTHGWVAAFAAWPLLEMAHSAMRIVAVSFLLGLAMIRWTRPQPPPQTTPR